MTNKSALSDGAASAISSSSAASAGTVAASAPVIGGNEALGEPGRLLSAYHVGDVTGLLGLLLTGLTLWQARAAKVAAEEAARTAIRSRDRIEVAARLTELANRLRQIRDVYRSDDWSYLDASKDQAAALAVEVAATLKDDALIVQLMTDIRAEVRSETPLLEHLKDDAKRKRMKTRWANGVGKLADAVDLAKLTKVKHES